MSGATSRDTVVCAAISAHRRLDRFRRLLSCLVVMFSTQKYEVSATRKRKVSCLHLFVVLAAMTDFLFPGLVKQSLEGVQGVV